jgi:hypothetical protein
MKLYKFRNETEFSRLYVGNYLLLESGKWLYYSVKRQVWVESANSTEWHERELTLIGNNYRQK